MKKFYVLASAVLLSTGAFAQGTELFFSEYDEGAHSSNATPPAGYPQSLGSERAIEIFNPTNQDVNLNVYSIRRYNNGGSSAAQEEKLLKATGANVIPSGETFVYASYDARIPEILGKADQISSAYSASGPTIIVGGGAGFFNGNDAMALVRWTGSVAGQGTPVIVDIFGVIGHDPGAYWQTILPNGKTVRSSNQSLIRKPHISGGVRVNPTVATYQIGDEWEAYSDFRDDTTNAWAQSYDNLGSHFYTGPTGNYNTTATVGLLEDFNNSISVYPNPATAAHGVTVNLANNVKVASIEILNVAGQTIRVTPNRFEKEIRIATGELKPGLYFVRFVSADQKMAIYKELIVQ